ncbi:alpha/beta hydrolase [Thermoleophilia bacterium SCSIO 60948]|nr:alpha/beta hydrolase [Thermoleophilia bacterium SCSIO 60948]
MAEPRSDELDGALGRVVVHEWPNPDARFVCLLAHGYGEHARRYDHVAAALIAEGAAVFAPDHAGHGRSDGERALVPGGDEYAADLHAVAELARERHPGLPVALIGHSMGGLIATRYAQLHGDELAALVLSGPAIGENPGLMGLLEMDPIPEVPIDPAALSRDPAVGEAYMADPLVYHGGFRRETLQSFVEAVERIAAGPGFGELPVLYLHGEEDKIVPIEPTRAAIANLRGERTQERSYPGAEHEIFNETNRDEVLGDVIGFLRTSLAG